MTDTIFSILISTKNRREALGITLRRLLQITDAHAEVVVIDDGSDDGTFDFVKTNFPWVKLQRNERSEGYLSCRNKMLNETRAQFAISLDDDAHFLTDNPFGEIKGYFEANPQCGLIAMRIFWGLQPPSSEFSTEKPGRVKSFVGCGHAWRMESWKKIPDYPEWFRFYGEEDFASYQLFKKNIEVHYLPSILVHHRVDVTARKGQKDYSQRLRKSLRSGWYLFFLFYPLQKTPGLLAYSVWMQLKNKVLKGDFPALKAMLLAGIDLITAMPKIIRQSNRLTKKEYAAFQRLPLTRIYWNPENTTNEIL